MGLLKIKDLANGHESVAVVIPNRNYSRWLGRAVKSAVEQTVRPAEVIIVDGESTDGSRLIVESIMTAISLDRKTAGDSTQVRWISTAPRGQANARNVGIRLATAELIVPLDADDWIRDDYIERCLERLEPEADVIAPALEWPDGRVQHVQPPFTLEHFLEGNLMFTCSMFRRSAWERVEGYCEEPGIYEDWMFWASIAASGGVIQPFRLPLFHYCPHDGSSSYGINTPEYWDRTIEKLRSLQCLSA
jgi:glycosyltransferase involved in cell wall biosynthesis